MKLYPGKHLILRGYISYDEDEVGRVVKALHDCHGVKDPAKMMCSPLFAGDSGIVIEIGPNRDCNYRVAFGAEVLWVRSFDMEFTCL